MVCVLLVASLLFASETFASTSPGHPPRAQLHLEDWSSYIVNGEAALPGEFPSQLYLPTRRTVCGASILSGDWALTTAYCVDGEDPNNLVLLAGTNDRTNSEYYYLIDKIITHDKYEIVGGYTVNDIAVVKVQIPFDLDQAFIKPITLPEQGLPTVERSNATVIGWGLLGTNGAFPTLLHKVNVEVIPLEECRSAYGNVSISEAHICASTEGSKGFCTGDAGGPLFVDGVVVGLVSWSPEECSDPLKPGVYTRVSSYRDWIDEVTGTNYGGTLTNLATVLMLLPFASALLPWY